MKLKNLIEVMDERLIIRVNSAKKDNTLGRYVIEKKLNMDTQEFEYLKDSEFSDPNVFTVADLKRSKIYHKLAMAELLTWSITRIKNFENFKNTDYKGRIVLITIVSL